MARYISTFPTGFEKVVEKQLAVDLNGCKIEQLFHGMICYSYSGHAFDICKLKYLNNSFFVIKSYNRRNLKHEDMVSDTGSFKFQIPVSRKDTFRLRFVKENQFVSVDSRIVNQSEKNIKHNTGLKVNRVKPDIEFWFNIRQENFGFFGCLFSKREFGEKNLKQGELRPEVAYLLCLFAGIHSDDILCDPFAGFGAIPSQMIKFRISKLFINDNDRDKHDYLRDKFEKHRRCIILCEDILLSNSIPDDSIDAVITDPPWGIFEHIPDIEAFYLSVLLELKRICKSNGQIVLLTAKKMEMQKAIEKAGFKITDVLNVLINGKKADVYKIYNNK